MTNIRYVWWMCGVVKVWCSQCPILHMVWSMSGVDNVCLVNVVQSKFPYEGWFQHWSWAGHGNFIWTLQNVHIIFSFFVRRNNNSHLKVGSSVCFRPTLKSARLQLAALSYNSCIHFKWRRSNRKM